MLSYEDALRTWAAEKIGRPIADDERVELEVEDTSTGCPTCGPSIDITLTVQAGYTRDAYRQKRTVEFPGYQLGQVIAEILAAAQP